MSTFETNWNNLRHAVLSDIGMRRQNNQDSHTIVLATDEDAWRGRGHFFMVADGMGAHAAGELASKIAVDGVPHRYLKYHELSPPEALQKAILETNAEVHRRGQANSDFRNMGTTASSMVLLPQGALVAHIGDSRVYRLRRGVLHQLTFDHSLVWELRQSGQLKAESEFANSIPKNVITRSLGPNASVEVDIEGPFPIEPGDTFLLCSDGLTGKLEDDELASILAALAPSEAVELLVDLANLRGGPDNITAIVARVTGERPEAADPEPLRLGGETGRRTLHPGALVLGAFSLMMAIVLVITHRTMPGGIAAASGVIILLAGWLAKARASTPGQTLPVGQRLGKGPYTETRCPTAQDLMENLARMTGNLRKQKVGPDLEINWETFDAHCQKAAEHRAGGRPVEAIRAFAQGIHDLMEQVQTFRRSSEVGFEDWIEPDE